MIIEMFLNALYNIFDTLTSFISIPPFPDEVLNYLTTFCDYINAGAGILSAYTPYYYLATLFGVIVAVDVGIKIYHFVMWVLRKIPVASIS